MPDMLCGLMSAYLNPVLRQPSGKHRNIDSSLARFDTKFEAHVRMLRLKPIGNQRVHLISEISRAE